MLFKKSNREKEKARKLEKAVSELTEERDTLVPNEKDMNTLFF